MVRQRVRSAAEIEGGSQTWDQIRRTALDQVASFCQRYGMNPAEFMSNMGWMRSERWRQGMDWRSCVDWNRFNDLIFSNISANKRGLDIGGFNQDLRSSREGYLEEASRPRRPDAARAVPRRRPAPTEQAPAEERRTPSRAEGAPRPRISDQRWADTYGRAETVMDRYSNLTDEQRDTIHNIIDLAGPGNQRLVRMNLRSYLTRVQELGGVTRDQMDSLYHQLVRDAVAYAEAPEPPQRLAQPTRRDEAAPAREETYVYRLAVSRREPAELISTFEIVSPQPIESVRDLINALRSPEGMQVTRLSNTGRRIPVPVEQFDLLQGRLARIQFDPNIDISLERQRRRA